MSKVKKENKYLVIKWDDVNKYLTADEQGEMDGILNMIDKGRRKADKSPLDQNKYLIVNQDEPYADLVWQIIIMGEKAKEYDEANRKKEKGD